MGGINVSRWLLGGVVAAVIIWIIEGAASMFYMPAMTKAMEEHNLSMQMNAATWMMTILVSLLTGLFLVFIYAALRPRFGPGPKTAVIAALVWFFGAYLTSLIGYQMIGLFPASMLWTWGLIGLIEMTIASIAGAWIYREEPAAMARPATA